MNMHTGNIMKDNNVASGGVVNRPYGKAPAVGCPACGARANVRSSEEISPTYRRLYLACSNFICGMTFVCSLSFEHVLSPSGVSAEFRPAKIRDEKAPGHDFGQMSIFDLMAPDMRKPDVPH
ncbi:MAG: hypothetical protein E2598_06310 [Sphingobium sp.]|nr:hypothetical protein [Sphingobium sp.]